MAARPIIPSFLIVYFKKLFKNSFDRLFDPNSDWWKTKFHFYTVSKELKKNDRVNNITPCKSKLYCFLFGSY